MGMFDYFHSSCDLGEGFTNVLCQTKEIDPSGLGGTMSNYWLSPAGCLYVATYRETHNFEEIKEGDPDYNENMQFLNYRWVPTGEHGKVEPFFVTAYVEIYPAEWAGDWEDWPRMKLHFKSGKLVEYRCCERGEAFCV